jgi:hypothetical protein
MIQGGTLIQRRIGLLGPTQRPRRAFLLGGALSLFFCVLALPVSLFADQVDRILAAVNHEVVTASDLRHAVALNTRFGNSREDLTTIESETLEGLITGRLLVQEAPPVVDISDRRSCGSTR